MPCVYDATMLDRDMSAHKFIESVMLNLDGVPLPLQAVVGLSIALSFGQIGSLVIGRSVGGDPNTTRADAPAASSGKKRSVSINDDDDDAETEAASTDKGRTKKKPRVLDAERPLEEFTCPISFSLPIDPVIAQDGRCYDRHHIDAYIRHHHTRRDCGGANPLVLRSLVTNVPMGTTLTPVSQNTINTIQYLVDCGAADDDETVQRWNDAAALRKVTRTFIMGGGSGKSIRSLGYFYRDGLHGLPVDKHLAHDWYMKAAEKKDRIAIANAGLNFVYGIGVRRDEVRGVGMMKEAVDMGLADAWYFMGMWHSIGAYGVTQSREIANRYLATAVPWLVGARKAEAEACLKLLEHRICPRAKEIADAQNRTSWNISSRFGRLDAVQVAEKANAEVFAATIADLGVCGACVVPEI